MVKAVVAAVAEEETVVGVGRLAAGAGRFSVRGVNLVVKQAKMLLITMAMMTWTGMAMEQAVVLGRISLDRLGTARDVGVRGLEARVAGVRGVEVAKEEEGTLLHEMSHLCHHDFPQHDVSLWQCHSHVKLDSALHSPAGLLLVDPCSNVLCSATLTSGSDPGISC